MWGEVYETGKVFAGITLLWGSVMFYMRILVGVSAQNLIRIRELLPHVIYLHVGEHYNSINNGSNGM